MKRNGNGRNMKRNESKTKGNGRKMAEHKGNESKIKET